MKSIDRWLTEILKKEKIAGMSVSVTDKKGIVYSRAFGVDSMERPEIPATTESMYRIASVTKMFTGVTVMRLVEEGALSLDTPICKYLSWLRLSDKEATERVTMRHLLSHTAGLPGEYTPVGTCDEDAIIRTLKEALPSLALHAKPGEGYYLYSNWGIRLVSAAVIEITGKRFSDVVREYVLSPLGMDKTTFDLRAAATYPISLPHVRDVNGAPTVYHYINENAARIATGGLYSSTEELAKFARFLLCGGVSDSKERLLSEESLLEMWRSHTPKRSDTENHYGLTMILHRTDNGILYGHTGSAPPYSSSVFIDRERELGVCTLINTSAEGLSKKIPETVLSLFV